MSILGRKASAYAAMVCDDWSVGYSQPRRWNIRPGGHTDCSALVARAYNHAGISPAFPENQGTWTGTLRRLCAARGFAVESWGRSKSLHPGDLLLSEKASGGTGHVAIHTGDGVLREAWVAETGGIDGAGGDQTGQETRTIANRNHPLTAAGRWTHILRAPADSTSSTTTTNHPEEDDMFDNSDRAKLDAVSYLLHNNLGGAIADINTRTFAASAQLAQITATLGGLSAAVEALATSNGVDPEKIIAAVKESVDAGVARALEGVEITLDTKKEN